MISETTTLTELAAIVHMRPSKPPKRTDVIANSKKQTSLRGAKRRGNLYQVAIVPNEAVRQRREVATPSGLAMTSVFSGSQ